MDEKKDLFGSKRKGIPGRMERKRFSVRMLMMALSALLLGASLLAESGWRRKVRAEEKETAAALSAEKRQTEISLPPLEELDLYALSAVLLDADSGRILYEKSGHEKMSMASTTKIMTCIIALENGDPEEEVEISAYAAGMPKVKLYARQGETYLLKDLLYSMMLESHNDSAAAIAEHIGRSYLSPGLAGKTPSGFTAEESKMAVAAFAELMNRKAAELGCMDTWFITPNGLDASETFSLAEGGSLTKEHGTTAADLAAIMSYCICRSPQAEKFLEITGCPSYSFTANGRYFSCQNHNAFLTMMEGALSGKTGFTNKAGYCYVGALTRDNRTLVTALLACGWPNNRSYKWSDARKLMQYGLDHFTYHDFAQDDPPAQQIPALTVTGARTEALDGVSRLELTLSEQEEGLPGLLLREDEEVQVLWEVPEAVRAPLEKGTVVGKLQYKVGDAVYLTRYLETCEGAAAPDYCWRLHQIWERFLP